MSVGIMKKINIAIILPTDFTWNGEKNYFSSIISALDILPNKKVKINIFLGEQNQDFVKKLKIKHLNIIYSKIFKRNTFYNFLNKIFSIIFGYYNILLYLYFKSKKITHISYFTPIVGFKNLVWFPDFQHIHLNKFFSKKDQTRRDKLYKNLIKYGDLHIVSSNDSKKDLIKFNNKSSNLLNTHVLNFIPNVNFENILNYQDLKKKYKIKKRYIYIPNQFWLHKNHITLFKSIEILKKQNKIIQFILTGSKNDYRNLKYFKVLKSYLKNKNLEQNVKYLGEVPYNHVISLIHNCYLFINPSLFEGWSTTVEEAKIFKKKILLSNINVHIEQKDYNSVLFDKNDHIDLANKISKIKGIQPKKLLQLKKNYQLKKKTFSKKIYEMFKNQN